MRIYRTHRPTYMYIGSLETQSAGRGVFCFDFCFFTLWHEKLIRLTTVKATVFARLARAMQMQRFC